MQGPTSARTIQPDDDAAADLRADLRADLLERNPSRSLAAFEVAQAAAEPHRFDLLVTALDSRNQLVGMKAAEALESYGKAAVGPLLRAIDEARILVKERIVRALGVIGSPQAVAALVDLLHTTGEVSMRYTIIEALGNLGDSSLVELLRPYLDDGDHHVREKTQIALEKLTS